MDRCYECPLTALEEAMDSGRGQVINRAFRMQNLMDAKIQVGLADITMEEAHVLELIRDRTAARARRRALARHGTMGNRRAPSITGTTNGRLGVFGQTRNALT